MYHVKKSRVYRSDNLLQKPWAITVADGVSSGWQPRVDAVMA